MAPITFIKKLKKNLSQALKIFIQYLGVFLLLGLLWGCESAPDALAPVSDFSSHPEPKKGFYRVKTGDSLYSIAWMFGVDYRSLIKANHLMPPYVVHLNQVLRINHLNVSETPSSSWQKISKPVSMITHPTINLTNRQIKFTHIWVWPVKGPILNQFSNNPIGNKGINIGGNYRTPIHAAADGIVVYSGDGVRGYGNLIIIKHSASYLSAYAYNQSNWVKEGSVVTAGQTIGLMGRNDGGKVMLHFEIRRNGQPINPLNLLKLF